MIHASFQLTMPNRGSWNGKWSGEDNKYYIVRSFKEKSPEGVKLRELLKDKNNRAGFYYSWTDGWGANVELELVDTATKSKRLKTSAGFCGYNWMVDSILKHGAIYADHQVPKQEQTTEPTV